MRGLDVSPTCSVFAVIAAIGVTLASTPVFAANGMALEILNGPLAGAYALYDYSATGYTYTATTLSAAPKLLNASPGGNFQATLRATYGNNTSGVNLGGCSAVSSSSGSNGGVQFTFSCRTVVAVTPPPPPTPSPKPTASPTPVPRPSGALTQPVVGAPIKR